MKKFVAIFMVFVMCISSFYVVAQESYLYETLESIGDYGSRNYIYDNFELNYVYEDETKIMDKDDLTYNEFDALLIALSDKHLVPADKQADKLIEVTDEEFPKSGYVEFVDKSDGNWVIGFDEQYVYARCINPVDKSFKHGFFSYTGTIDMGLWAFIKNLAKKDDEVITEPEDTSKEENTEDDLPVQEEIKRNRAE